MYEHRRAVDNKIQIQGDTMKINQLGQVAEAKMKCNETPAGEACPVHGLKECAGYSMTEVTESFTIQRGNKFLLGGKSWVSKEEVEKQKFLLYRHKSMAQQVLDKIGKPGDKIVAIGGVKEFDKAVSEERTEVKDKEGKVVSWKDEGDWKKASKKDPRGKVTNMSDKARKETAKLSKNESLKEAHIVSMHIEDDHEVKMAQGDLYQMAKKTIALHKMLDNVDQLEGWVQGKITLAADYIATVYDYMDHQLAMAGNIDGIGEQMSEAIMPTGSTVSAKKLPPQTAQVVKKISQGINPAQHAVMTDPEGNVSVVAKKDVAKKNAQGNMSVTEEDNVPAQQYKSLNDVYPAGSTEVWYWKEDFARDAMMGAAWLAKQGRMPKPENIKDNYVLIGKIAETNPDKVFMKMQGEMWSPRGQARNMIRASGTGHTSMSVGDIVKIGNKYLMVDRFGFQDITQQPQEESVDVRLTAKPMDESVMSEIDAELREIVKNEDYDAVYNLMSANTPTGRYIQNMADDIAIDHRLHPDDDFEQIEEYVWDRLVQDFGVGESKVQEADQPEADGNENGIYQMRKVINLRGQYDVPFADGKKVRVPVNMAHAVLQKFASLKMPNDKLAFTRAVTKSFGSLKAAIGVREDVDARAKKIFGEDWGSSDTSAAINMMKEYIRSTHGGRYNPETIEDAARDAGEFYYDQMGYDTPEEAADSLVSHFVRRWMSGSLQAD